MRHAKTCTAEFPFPEIPLRISVRDTRRYFDAHDLCDSQRVTGARTHDKVKFWRGFEAIFGWKGPPNGDIRTLVVK